METTGLHFWAGFEIWATGQIAWNKSLSNQAINPSQCIVSGLGKDDVVCADALWESINIIESFCENPGSWF